MFSRPYEATMFSDPDDRVTTEGSWDQVMKVIGQAHSLVHKRGVVRVQSSMRVGTRTDKKQTAADKVKRVQDILEEDSK